MASSPRLKQSLRSRVSLAIAPLAEANRVFIEHHYLHRGRTMAQLAYWIEVDRTRVGALLFALPRLSVPFRGHHPMTLIELARLWLDPAVQGVWVRDHRGRPHNLPVASCAIGQSLRLVRQDWAGKYPHLPAIDACVAWSDRHLHEGTIYRATNFVHVGRSGGSLPGGSRRRSGGSHVQHADYRREKDAYLFTWAHPLSQHERAVAEEAWRSTRPRRQRTQSPDPGQKSV